MRTAAKETVSEFLARGGKIEKVPGKGLNPKIAMRLATPKKYGQNTANRMASSLIRAIDGK